MPLSNAEKEMIWVDGWNDLFDDNPTMLMLDSDWNEIDQGHLKGLIQEQAYQSLRARLEDTFFNGKRATRVVFEKVNPFSGDRQHG